MKGTAGRRPITSHPAFAPVIGLWFAALFGATMAVLPASVLARGLEAVGLGAPVPLSLALRLAISAAAAAVGGAIGFALARRIALRDAADPRPIYAEPDDTVEERMPEAPLRRPLRVREELADGFGDESEVKPAAPDMEDLPDEPATTGYGATRPTGGAAYEPFMILTPQPIHPPQLDPDLEALLEQFDHAFASYHSGATTQVSAKPDADPVQAFVAQQTGVPPPTPSPSRPASPLGGLVPDHQAELRAALDKLARSQRGER